MSQGVGQVGERGALMGAVPFPCSVPLPAKTRNGNCERRCRGESIQKSQVEVVEQEFPYISAGGYILI